MTQKDGNNITDEHQSPRAQIPLDVNVEIAGERRRLKLSPQDIGVGGIFLRTDSPGALWKKALVILDLPAGKKYEITGEVVRRVTPEKAAETGQPAGMVIAFDDTSRNKRKELIAVVLDLCSRQSESAPPKPAAPVARSMTPAKGIPKATSSEGNRSEDDTDHLLDEINSLLESVEREQKSSVASADKTAAGKTSSTPRKPADPATDNLESHLREYEKTHKTETYYDILGINPSASPQEIEKAYQQLIKQLNPPASLESVPAAIATKLSTVLVRIKKAFAILSKEDRKRAYDFLINNKMT
jgi:hypothetical protein